MLWVPVDLRVTVEVNIMFGEFLRGSWRRGISKNSLGDFVASI
jgi:hypothetical protein